jgi:arabinose-5-phosphate isomerase
MNKNYSYSNALTHFISVLEETNKFIDKKCIDIASKAIIETKGSVIISGVGKTGLIGNLFAAGLKSIGLNVFFVHSTEASHGDIGAINKNDLIIIMSKSGQSVETFALLDYCKFNNITTLGICMNANSYLIKNSTHSIVLPAVEEQPPVFALPSASNMVFTGICESIKLVIANKINLTTKSFVNTHPGGKIGKNNKNIKSIMRTEKDIPCIIENEKTTLNEVVDTITDKQCGCVFICNKNNSIKGIITDGDLRRFMSNNSSINMEKSISNMFSMLMPTIIGEEDSLESAKLIMAEQGMSQLPVVDSNNSLVGVVHMGDIMRSELQPFDVTMDRK